LMYPISYTDRWFNNLNCGYGFSSLETYKD
jgi:hypothetical protein